MGPAIGGDDLVPVVRFREQDDELGRCDDLSNRADVIEAHVEGAKRGGDAAQRRVVLIAHLFGPIGRRGLVQAGERRGRRSSGGTTSGSASSASATAGADIGTSPPHARQIRVPVGKARRGLRGRSICRGRSCGRSSRSCWSGSPLLRGEDSGKE